MPGKKKPRKVKNEEQWSFEIKHGLLFTADITESLKLLKQCEKFLTDRAAFRKLVREKLTNRQWMKDMKFEGIKLKARLGGDSPFTHCEPAIGFCGFRRGGAMFVFMEGSATHRQLRIGQWSGRLMEPYAAAIYQTLMDEGEFIHPLSSIHEVYDECSSIAPYPYC